MSENTFYTINIVGKKCLRLNSNNMLQLCNALKCGTKMTVDDFFKANTELNKLKNNLNYITFVDRNAKPEERGYYIHLDLVSYILAGFEFNDRIAFHKHLRSLQKSKAALIQVLHSIDNSNDTSSS